MTGVLLPIPRIPGVAAPGGEVAPAARREDGSRILGDRHGRVATDLRFSVTDRCNLRCTYCMPADGLDWTEDDRVLTDDEVLRLIRIGTSLLGIRTVRLTGGEPLLRKNLERLVAGIAALPDRPRIALTSNAIGLARRAQPLADAGLDRVNISLDTLDRDTFTRLARRDRLQHVLAGIAAAQRAGLEPVKINSVLMRGVNDHEALPLARWAMAEGVQLRFIEQMPLDAQHGWDREQMITADEIRDRLAEELILVEDPADREARGSAPAELFRVEGTEHRIGIIAAVSKPFCGACDRVRLTADGQLRNCLFARTEQDLRIPLRSGATDEEIADQWVAAVASKLPGHGIDDPSFLQPDRPMSAIGG